MEEAGTSNSCRDLGMKRGSVFKMNIVVLMCILQRNKTENAFQIRYVFFQNFLKTSTGEHHKIFLEPLPLQTIFHN